jgi:hypothetical protein
LDRLTQNSLEASSHTDKKVPPRAENKMKQLEKAVAEGFQAKSALGQAFARYLKEESQAGPGNIEKFFTAERFEKTPRKLFRNIETKGLSISLLTEMCERKRTTRSCHTRRRQSGGRSGHRLS